jgi:hypothetical protein
MAGGTAVELTVKTPAAGSIASSLRAGAPPYAKSQPSAHQPMVDAVAGWAPRLTAGLGLGGHPLPPVWTVDLVGGVGGGDNGGGAPVWHALKFDCGCVGITAAQQLAGPIADAVVAAVETAARNAAATVADAEKTETAAEETAPAGDAAGAGTGAEAGAGADGASPTAKSNVHAIATVETSSEGASEATVTPSIVSGEYIQMTK